MDGYKSVREKSEEWKVSERRVTEFCRTGRIDGAVKKGRRWFIPLYSGKPTEEDYVSESYVDYGRAPYPMVQGSDIYTDAVEGKYFVDKTLFIRDVMNDPSLVLLFTRPRRFGKSLNLDMLRVFTEKTKKDSSVYFRGRKIWSETDTVRTHFAKYPVIMLTLKELFLPDMKAMTEKIKETVSLEYRRHGELEKSMRLSEEDRKLYTDTVKKNISESGLRSSLFNLSRLLHLHHKRKCMILIDEYDVPIAQGNSKGFLEEMVSFMRSFLGEALKSNPYLEKGVLTGIMKVSKESIFSGLNNIVTYSLLDEKYSEYFGFTEEDIKNAASYYDAEEKLSEIERWYDGYVFGKEKIYNPWSVARYFNNSMTPGAYWENESENLILRSLLLEAGKDAEDALISLLEGKKIPALIDTSVTYPLRSHDLNTILSMLTVSGYLRCERKGLSMTGMPWYEVSIPNMEIKAVWNREILALLEDIFPSGAMSALQLAVMQGETEKIEKSLGEFLRSSVSFYDTEKENFYHGLMLGLTVLFTGYKARSNKESGKGRFDIMLAPKDPSWPGIIIEVKALSGATDEDLEKSAENALSQIEERDYAAELDAEGVKRKIFYGAAFSGKNIALLSSASN